MTGKIGGSGATVGAVGNCGRSVTSPLSGIGPDVGALTDGGVFIGLGFGPGARVVLGLPDGGLLAGGVGLGA